MVQPARGYEGAARPDAQSRDAAARKEEDLYPVFCKALAHQELDDKTRYVDIPDEVQEMYKVYRPSPLIRAYNLEKALGTPPKIYYKFEGNNTSGSHKLNSAIAQAYYAKEEGLTSLTTETGAGQWGTALAEACAYFHLPLTVYMVKVSYEQKPFRKAIIHTFGAGRDPKPLKHHRSGAQDPCRRSEQFRVARHGDFGSGRESGHNRRLPLCAGLRAQPVLLHQSIIAVESKIAMEMLDEYPDIVIGCAGGGSILGGLIAPFMQDKLTAKPTRASSPWSPPPARRSRAARRLRLLRHRQNHAHGKDVYARL